MLKLKKKGVDVRWGGGWTVSEVREESKVDPNCQLEKKVKGRTPTTYEIHRYTQLLPRFPSEGVETGNPV